ncbi:host attachment protein [Dyella ginsengisoli]|uniref:host attachment protein n=1 Tax=Dyella ginsengisoli TaxID=363848 RepID=UPI000347570B|nr:host attachment protein [Dyella ginsengisoli]
MASTWILVADAARARVFESDRRGGPWTVVSCLANPDGRAPGRDATTERAPRTMESVGSARHAIEPHTSLRDKSSERFARMLRDELERGCTERRCEQLVLVAPPRFLGTLHGVLDKALRERVSGELHNDFTALEELDVRERVLRELSV